MANLSALLVKSSVMQMNATLSPKAHQSGQPRLIELTGPRIPDAAYKWSLLLMGIGIFAERLAAFLSDMLNVSDSKARIMWLIK